MEQAKQNDLMRPRFYTREDLRTVLDTSIGTVDKLLRRKDYPIPSLRVGHKILIPCDQFDAWVAEESARGPYSRSCQYG